MKSNSTLIMLFCALFSSIAYSQSPNVIVIIADDMGWSQVSTPLTNLNNESDFYETPTLETLASEGIAFPHAYVNGANCAPTRAALLSGQYAARPTNNIFNVDHLNRAGSGVTPTLLGPDMGLPSGIDELPVAAITLAETMQTAGYTTVHLGKYHVGENENTNVTNNAATDQGFDVNYGGGTKGNPGSYFASQSGGNWTFHNSIGPELDVYADPYTSAESTLLAGDGSLTGTAKHVTDAMADAAIDFMNANINDPFFMHFSNFAVHGPLGAGNSRPDLYAKYQAKNGTNPSSMGHTNLGIAAIAEGMDQTIGRLIDYLKTTADPRNPGFMLSENTLVYFISDNGGALNTQENGPLRAKKGDYYEGGIRSVTLVWSEASWLENKGTVNSTPVIGFDIYPTFVEAAGGTLPSGYDIDGVSHWQMLTSPSAPLTREALFWHFPGYIRTQKPVTVIRKGDYKLLHFYETADYEFYNLITDISETTNLLAGSPDQATIDLANDLVADMITHLTDTSAPLPTYINGPNAGNEVPLPALIISVPTNSTAGCQPENGYEAYWDFDTVTNANDASANSHNPTSINGTITYDTVDFKEGDQSAIFDGTVNIQYSSAPFLTAATSTRTVMAWIKPTSLSGIQNVLDEGGGTKGIGLRLNGTNLESIVRSTSSLSDQISAAYPNDGDWHHIALVYDGGNTNQKLYIDGVEVANGAAASSIGNHTGLGGVAGKISGTDSFGNSSAANFNGKMDAFAIYETVLNATQIEDSACLGAVNGPGGVTTNLELWLKANKGVEEAVVDSAEHLDPVLNWLDNTINANDATQTTGINKPIFNESAINFNPTVDFDGTNHEMLASISSNSTMTIFGVAEGTYSGSTKHLLNLNGGGSGSVILEQTTSVTARSRFYDGSGASGIVTTTIANGAPFLINYDFIAGVNSQLFNYGTSQGSAATNGNTLPGTLTAGIGTHPTNPARRWNGGIAEMVVYNGSITTTERNKIESYLAIKYGMTLGVNGASQDYVDSDGTVIWDQSVNSGYNFDIAGIGRDNTSELNQKQSSSTSSIDGTISMGLTDLYTTNANNILNNPTNFNNKEYLMWGNNGVNLNLAASIVSVDVSAGISGLTTNVSFTAMQRIWKVVENGGDIPKVKVAIPQNAIINIAPPGNYYMFISDTGVFDSTADYKVMTPDGSGNLEVIYDFDGTKFITFGYAPQVVLEGSIKFDGVVDYIDMDDVLDLNASEFTISAWIKREVGSTNSSILSKRDVAYTEGYDFKINNSGNFLVSWNGGSEVITSSVSIPINEWHQVSIVYGSGTATLYIDGVADTSGAKATPIATSQSFFIAAAGKSTPTAHFIGNIDEVRVWDVALTSTQLRFIMNQEIENNTSFVRGKYFENLGIIPTKNDVSTISWSDLAGYYPMSIFTYKNTHDESGNSNQGMLKNLNTVDIQTAPLPYESTQNGDWDNKSTWLNGNNQTIPGTESIVDSNVSVDWNIVKTSHNISIINDSDLPTTNNGNRLVLGLLVDSNKITVDGSTTNGTGFGLTVTHFLSLDGDMDLQGESQLIQTTNSDLDVTSSGKIERDQQGTADMYTYNYWSSPVGVSNITSNNNNYTLPNILRDGTQNINFITSGFDGTNTNPIGIADYWIWKFANQTDDDYSSWQHVRSTGSILAGEGYTMKGPGSGAVLDDQNYVFLGKPNNGDINLTINAGNDYLVGNPYASAIDAHTFINDNAPTIQGNGPTTGTLYFWEHWGGGSHYLLDYQGGYATYNLSGGTPTAAIGTIDPDVGTGGSPTKTPGRYIPVGQGFFVIGEATGTIKFNNNQRVFRKENASSVFMSPNQGGDEVFTGRSAQQDNDLGDQRLKIRLGFNSVNTLRRQILLTIDEIATDAIDFGYDGKLYENQIDDMYWMIGDEKLIIQGRGLIEDETILPLGIHTDSEGINSIALDSVENASSELEIYLHDKELNIYHDLRESSSEFYLTEGEHFDRFEITFSNHTLSIIENELDVFDVNYTNSIESIVIVNPKLQKIKTVKMFSILGQLIYENDSLTTESYIKLKVSDLNAGIYILKLETDDNEIISVKVLVK